MFAWAGSIVTLSEVTKLLKVSGIAVVCFGASRKADTVCINDVDNCVILSFQANVGPSSHTSWVGGDLVTASSPTSRGKEETSARLEEVLGALNCTASCD